MRSATRGSVDLAKQRHRLCRHESLIYRIESVEPYLTASAPLWDALHAQLQKVATSEMTLLEVLVKPLRQGNVALAALYRGILLETAELACLPIECAVLEVAARLRAAHGLKTPDAIHAASALEVGCTMFLTNDSTFRRVTGLPVTVLDEVVAGP